jgi:hypothetical protein
MGNYVTGLGNYVTATGLPVGIFVIVDSGRRATALLFIVDRYLAQSEVALPDRARGPSPDPGLLNVALITRRHAELARRLRDLTPDGS